MSTKILEMAKNIVTQDNRVTADPIFMVQQKVRTYGFDPDYSDDSKLLYCGVDDIGAEYSEAEREERYVEYCAMLAEANEAKEDDEPKEEPMSREDFDDDNYQKVYFQEHWENVQPFFTEVGAQEYLRINAHNLKEPQIYVESAFRNAEWQEIRNWLLKGAPNINGWIDAKVALPSIDTHDQFNAETYRSPDVLIWDGKSIAQGYLQYDADGPPFEDPPRWWIGDASFSVTIATHWCAMPTPPASK